jgi:hypothetical protein
MEKKMTELTNDELIDKLVGAVAIGQYDHLPKATLESYRLQATEAKAELLRRLGVAVSASPQPEKLAKLFHETYERLAPQFGYETRKESAKAWADVPPNNRRLMLAVCAELSTFFAPAQAQEPPTKIDEHLPPHSSRWKSGVSRGGASTGEQPPNDTEFFVRVFLSCEEGAQQQALQELEVEQPGFINKLLNKLKTAARPSEPSALQCKGPKTCDQFDKCGPAGRCLKNLPEPSAPEQAETASAPRDYVRCTNCGMYGFYVKYEESLGGMVLKCVDCGEQKLIEIPAAPSVPLVGKVVRVDNERFTGFGYATHDSGQRKRVISVMLGNGNTWAYDADTVRAATPEEIPLAPRIVQSRALPAPPDGQGAEK